jgi:hypothetical protein
MRGDGPFVFAQVTHGLGVAEIAQHLLAAATSIHEADGNRGQR